MEPPDGGGKSVTYADRLKTNVKYDQRLDRNILEIVLEKTEREADYDIPQESIARVFRTIGIDIEKHVEGYQVHSKGRNSLISVWVLPDINLEQFCRDDNIKVTEGVMTGSIRPAGRKDVTVTVCGLDFNTPDTFVFQYLSKFGRVANQKVIYSKYTEGPFRGKYNGDRKYNVDFSGDSSQPMGTYHIIDGTKTRIFYRGNIKTCGRCHRFAYNCPGEGIARVCEENNGDRIKLSDWMKELWKKVDFTPDTFELVDEDDKNGSLIADIERFPRLEQKKSKPSEQTRYCGFTLKNLPSDLSDSDIADFLINSGINDDTIKSKLKIVRGVKTTNVTAEPIDPELVTKATEILDFPQSRTKFFSVPLYCRPLRNQTPEKVLVPVPEKIFTPPPPSRQPAQIKKPSPTHIIGGVSFRELEGFDFSEETEKSKGAQNNKRTSVHRSPLDSTKGPKLVKK